MGVEPVSDDVSGVVAAADDEYVAFAGTDVEIGPIGYSTIGLGSATLDDAVDRIEAAVEAGMTLIDTADVWGFDPNGDDPAHGGGFGAAEARLGEVLAEVPGLRDQILLCTKGGRFPPLPLDSSPDYLTQACDASLYRLGVEVIDLYQVHGADLLAHPADVAEALMGLRNAGKVREVGVCGYSIRQIEALQHYLEAPLVSLQLPLSALHTDGVTNGSLDHAICSGITPLASSPLAGGAVLDGPTGNVLRRIAGEQGVRPSAVALAWLLHHPAGVVPMVGTTRVNRIRQCARADEVGLSRQQWYEVWSALHPEWLPGA